MSQRRTQVALGVIALASVSTNVVWHVAHGTWFDAFWLCNAAALLAGVALLVRSPLLATGAFVWLLPGVAAWSYEALLLGSTFPPPSYLLHVSGFVAAAYAVRALGAHRAGYAAGLLLFALLVALSRWLPPEANVNCAFGPRASWTAWSALDLPHHLSVALVAVVVAVAMNRLALLWFTWARSPAPGPRSSP